VDYSFTDRMELRVGVDVSFDGTERCLHLHGTQITMSGCIVLLPTPSQKGTSGFPARRIATGRFFFPDTGLHPRIASLKWG